MKPLSVYPPLQKVHLVMLTDNKIIRHNLMVPGAMWHVNEIWRNLGTPARYVPCACDKPKSKNARKENAPE